MFEIYILNLHVLELILFLLLCMLIPERLNIRIKIISVLYFIVLSTSIILEQKYKNTRYYKILQDTNTTNIIKYIYT